MTKTLRDHIKDAQHMTSPKLAQGKTGRHYTWPPNADTADLVVPSITTILNEKSKPALKNWASKLVAEYAVDNRDKWAALDRDDAVTLIKGAPNRYTYQRADIGTAIHTAIETHLTGDWQPGTIQPEPSVDPELLPYVAAALQFLNDYHVQPLHIEATVFNETYRYAGTGDLFATIVDTDGTEHTAIIDWKSKAHPRQKLYDEVALQLGALAHGEWIGVEDGTQHPVPDCTAGIAVALYDNATYRAYPIDLATYGDRIFRTFVALRTMHAWTADYSSVVFGNSVTGKAAG